MMRIIPSLFAVFVFSGLYAQSDLLTYSWRLSAIGYDMVECREASDRDSCLELFLENMDSALRCEGAFQHGFDSVENIRILPSPDGKFRLLTWGFRHPNDSFTFYGVIQFPDREAIWLNDMAQQIGNNDTAIHTELNAEKWFGALYYQIERIHRKRETYYVLLGWNGNTARTDRKVIDILRFDEQGEPLFGYPVFDMGKELYQHRVIFEYRSGASMALKMDENGKRIAFEHIQPSDPRAHGVYYLYLPDGTYDYLQFRKGIWVKEEYLFR